MTPERFQAHFDVSRETVAALLDYQKLIQKWTNRINLVSRSTLPDLWSRHFADSAQLLALAPPDARSWADLGSGGGLPGLVVAILARETRPGLHVTLIESDQRKAVFLRHAAQATGTACTIRNDRAEALAGETHDIVSARALAPLDRLLALAEPLLAPGGRCLFPKGASYRSELTEAARHWHTATEVVPSITDPESCILVVQEVKRVG